MKPEHPTFSRRHFVQQSSFLSGLLGAAGLAAAQSGMAAPAGGTAVAASPPVNARAFGAKSDGKTDDTKALQAALDAAIANGPVCFVPADCIGSMVG